MAQTAFDAATVLAVQYRRMSKRYRGQWPYQKWTIQTPGVSSDQYLKGDFPKAFGSGKPIWATEVPDSVWRGAGETRGGGNQYSIPEDQPLDSGGVSGDRSVEKTGASRSTFFEIGFVNQRRFPARMRDGFMSAQNLGAWASQIENNTLPELFDRAFRYHVKKGIKTALLKGSSDHIIGTAVGEFAQAVRWHPNFMVPGLPSGRGTSASKHTQQFPYMETTAATMEDTIAKMVAQISTGVEFHLSVAALEVVKQALIDLNVRPCFYDGNNPIWIMEVDNYLMAQLKADPALLNQKQNWGADPKMEKEFWQYGVGTGIIVNNILVLATSNGIPGNVYAYDTNAARDTLSDAVQATSANATKLAFGPVTDAFVEKDSLRIQPSYKTTDLPTGDGARDFLNRRIAVVWGEGALRKATAKHPLPITRELFDAKAIEEIYLSQIFGYNRRDLYDTPAPANFTDVYNDSSMICAFYAPPTNLAA